MATDAGKKALAELRAQNKTLEQQLAALAPLGELAKAMGVKPDQGKTDVQTLTEQVAKMQKDLAEEHGKRLRAEVAAARKLPPELASRLVGTTLEELTADADALIKAFPGAATGTPGTPAPDPTQGARGGVQQLETALAEAQKKGDAREAIRLKQLIAEAKRPK